MAASGDELAMTKEWRWQNKSQSDIRRRSIWEKRKKSRVGINAVFKSSRYTLSYIIWKLVPVQCDRVVGKKRGVICMTADID